MKILYLFLFFIYSCSVTVATAQTPQQELQKAVIELKKQISEQEKFIADGIKNKEDPETIKAMEDDLAQLKQELTMVENATKAMVSIPTSMVDKAKIQVESETEMVSSSIPPKKNSLLDALPKDELNKAQLQAFLNALYSDLKNKISAEKVTDVQKIINLLENDAEKIAFAGVAAWYNNAPAQSALLITYAATKSQSSNILNNCAAIMNLCSHEEKAIPILKYILVTHPTNSTVLNNLGQAYTGLGDKQTAMMFFGRCIQRSPHHPEANATAAKIEESMGNLDKALEYTEASLKGAYSEERAEFYNKNKKNCKIRVLFNTQELGHTQFFDPGSLSIPPNCRSWSQSASVHPLQEDYNEKIEALSKKYQQITLANQVSMQEIMTMGESPFNQAALFKKQVLGECYTERKQELYEIFNNNLNTLILQQQAEQVKLNADCDAAFNACVENPPCLDRASYKCCTDKLALDNKYFGLLSDLSDKYTLNNYTEDVGYYNSLIYLESVSYTNQKVLASTTAAETVIFLTNFPTYVMSTCDPAGMPDCEQLNPANQQNPNSPYFKDPQCSIGIKLSVGVGEVSLSCKAFAIEAGEFVKFGYEKDFITKESTLSMGPGLSADIPGILDAGASGKAYVKFDGNNQPIDVGVSGDVSIGVKGTTPIVSAGYTMGINSGFNFSGTSPF